MITTINEYKLLSDENQILSKIEEVKNRSVNVIDNVTYDNLDETKVYRGFSDSSDINKFVEKPKFAATMFGTGIYTTIDENMANMYGTVLEMKVNLDRFIKTKDLLKLVVDTLSLIVDNEYALKLYDAYYKDIGIASILLDYDGIIKEDSVILITNPSSIYLSEESIKI